MYWLTRFISCRWWRSNCTQAEVAKSQIKSSSELEIENMFGVFLILLGSIVLAIIVEVSKRVRVEIEKRWYKNKVKKEVSYTYVTIKIRMITRRFWQQLSTVYIRLITNAQIKIIIKTNKYKFEGH